VLLIQGNADSTGIEAKNIPLSVNRADAVKHELTKRGIKSSRITTIGHGSKDPVATNKTYLGKEENRNAVMTITPAKNEILIGQK
jgi:outer membrane protein OmpA-like peptidoglycan-associated protein